MQQPRGGRPLISLVLKVGLRQLGTLKLQSCSKPFCGTITQLVECYPYKVEVAGSSPAGPTIKKKSEKEDA